MKKLKSLLCIALLCLFAFLLFPGKASAAEKIDSKDGNWRILADYYNSTCTVLKWKGDTDTLTIPKTIDGLKVTKIDMYYIAGSTYLANAENPEKITSIIVPDTVKEIGGWSFSHLRNLKQAKIPSSVTTIGNGVFSNCTNLESIQMPPKVKVIPIRMFEDCTSLKTITFAKGTTKIDNGAFKGCTSLTSVSLPSTLTDIESEAFDKTGLTAVSIPNSVTRLGGTFNDCTSLVSVKLSTGITSLSYHTFGGCTSLRTLIIPANVSHINDNICGDCPNLTTIYIMGNPSYVGSLAKPTATLTIYSPSGSEKVREYCKNSGIKWKSLDAPKLTTKKRTTSAVTLKWNKVSGAAGYKVYKKTNSGKYKLVKTTTGTSFKDTGLKKGVTYRYYVITLLKDADGVELESVPSKVFKTKLKK